jgi:peptide/nickel transport system substrate-binding protein
MADHPVGTGPFELQSWTPNQNLTLVRNPDYWQPDRPYLNKVVFTFTASPSMRIAELQAGTVDFLYGAPDTSLGVLKADPALDVYGGGGQETFDYLWLNSSLAPLQSPLVRQAVYWALNRSVIAQAGGPTGLASPLNSGFLPSDYWVGTPKPIYHQDYAKSKRLLAEAGYPQGISFAINVPGDASPFQVTTAEVIQEELKPAGINATLNILNAPQLLADEFAHKFQAQVLGQPATVSPYQTFQEYFLPGGGQNDTGFHDAHLDRLLAEALASTRLPKQAALYRAAEERLADVGTMAFLFSWSNIDVLQKFVKGYVYSPFQISYSSLEDVWLAPHAGS